MHGTTLFLLTSSLMKPYVRFHLKPCSVTGAPVLSYLVTPFCQDAQKRLLFCEDNSGSHHHAGSLWKAPLQIFFSSMH